MIRPVFLLDTDTCIYIKKYRPANVRERLHAQRAGTVGMSVITWGELQFGAQMSQERSRALELLDDLARAILVFALPRGAGDRYGEIRAVLSRTGKMIGQNDLWIAAHALSEDLVLVTNNEREFRRVPGLKVENWVTGA